MSQLMPQKYFALPALSILDGLAQRASVQAERAAPGRDVHKNVIEAGAAHHLVGGVSRQQFRSLVPVQNLPLPVDEVHAIMQAIEQPLVE